MAFPSSDKFDIVDLNSRQADSSIIGTSNSDSLLDAVDTKRGHVSNVADGYVLFAALAEGSSTSGMTVNSSVEASSSLSYTDENGQLAYGIPQNFTLEFDIGPISLPAGFSTQTCVYVGASSQQGYTAGMLLSDSGIAYANGPDDADPVVLARGADLLRGPDGQFLESLTVRMVVSGEDGRISIYAAPTDEAYSDTSGAIDAPLMYSLAAKRSPLGSGDRFTVMARSVTGPGSEDVSFALDSIRISSSKVLPEDRPVAVASSAAQTVVGEANTLLGSESYDPTGEQLTYNWEIDFQPEASQSILQGSRRASASILDSSGTEAVLISAFVPTSKMNGVKVSCTASGVDSPLSLTYGPQGLSINLATDAQGDSRTTAFDLTAAFMDVFASGYDLSISGGMDLETGEEFRRIFSADQIIDNGGSTIIPAGEYELSGGSGSTSRDPILIPDEPGLYVVSLVVNNGTRNSQPSSAAITVSSTHQLFGHRPNSDYIFRYLPDFWKLVKDKEQLPSIWSAVTQVISADMVSAWQNDYSKSIKDVSRRRQRRWVSVPMSIETSDQYTFEIRPSVLRTPVSYTHLTLPTQA